MNGACESCREIGSVPESRSADAVRPLQFQSDRLEHANYSRLDPLSAPHVMSDSAVLGAQTAFLL